MRHRVNEAQDQCRRMTAFQRIVMGLRPSGIGRTETVGSLGLAEAGNKHDLR
jgi:hypothetical protein